MAHFAPEIFGGSPTCLDELYVGRGDGSVCAFIVHATELCLFCPCPRYDPTYLSSTLPTWPHFTQAGSPFASWSSNADFAHLPPDAAVVPLFVGMAGGATSLVLSARACSRTGSTTPIPSDLLQTTVTVSDATGMRACRRSCLHVWLAVRVSERWGRGGGEVHGFDTTLPCVWRVRACSRIGSSLIPSDRSWLLMCLCFLFSSMCSCHGLPKILSC